MKYRTLGKLDWTPSALGFGIMRMPFVGDDPAAIDEDEGTRMIRYAIDHGVNYVDTAYFYHKEQSESFVGRVLQDGYREKVKLATKPIPASETEPISRDEQAHNMAEFLTGLAKAVNIPAKNAVCNSGDTVTKDSKKEVRG